MALSSSSSSHLTRVTREAFSSWTVQTNIFQFLVWLATGLTFGYFVWTDSVHRKQDINLNIGNQIRGRTPALKLLDDKGRRKGGENPTGGARGGCMSEGSRDFLSRRQEVLMTFNFCNQHLIWLPGRFCSVKQSMADDSYVKVKIVRWVWLMERQTLGMR